MSMFQFKNVKQFVNKITDKGNGRESTGESSASFVESTDSAEGFLCPTCMRAFPSPESLEEHYQKTHEQGQESESLKESSDEILYLQHEILNLQSLLANERLNSEGLKNEIIKIHKEIETGTNDDVEKLKVQQKDFELSKSDMSSQLALLRSQLKESLEKASYLRKENSSLSEKLNSSEKAFKAEKVNWENQLAMRSNGNDDTETDQLKEKLRQITLDQENGKQELLAKIKNLEDNIRERENESKANIELIQTINKEKSKVQNDYEKIHQQNQEFVKNINSITVEHKNVLVALNSQLLNSERKRESLEKQSDELNEELKRQRQHHTELLSKIESGEGTKEMVLDGLKKENEILKQNLESAQNQNKEQSKNLHNVKMESDKWQSEYKKINESFEAEKEQWRVKLLLLTEQLKGKDDDMRKIGKKNEELIRSLHSKDEEVKSANVQIGTYSKDIEKLKKESESLNLSFNNLKQELHNKTNLENKFKENLAKKDQDLENLKLESVQLNSKLKEIGQNLEQSLCSKKELEKMKDDQILAIKKSNQALLDDLNSKIEEKEKKCQDLVRNLEKRSKELNELVISSNDEKAKLKNEVENLQCVKKEKESQIEKFGKSLKDLNSKCSESEEKVQRLEETLKAMKAQSEDILSEKSELEKKVKMSEEEKSLLLQRCLSGEGENEKKDVVISELKRKFDDSVAGLRELGRENQNLQMETAKLQGRKWTDDSLVNNCSNCVKEFSITIRKHHCRNCGKIFCSACSSQSASIPSSKKPVRVCENCFTELEAGINK